MADNDTPHSNSPQVSTQSTARLQAVERARDERRAAAMRELSNNHTDHRLSGGRPGSHSK
jgi:hypothetical protein